MKPEDDVRWLEWDPPSPEWTEQAMRQLRESVRAQNEREQLRQFRVLSHDGYPDLE